MASKNPSTMLSFNTDHKSEVNEQKTDTDGDCTAGEVKTVASGDSCSMRLPEMKNEIQRPDVEATESNPTATRVTGEAHGNTDNNETRSRNEEMKIEIQGPNVETPESNPTATRVTDETQGNTDNNETQSRNEEMKNEIQGPNVEAAESNSTATRVTGETQGNTDSNKTLSQTEEMKNEMQRSDEEASESNPTASRVTGETQEMKNTMQRPDDEAPGSSPTATGVTDEIQVKMFHQKALEKVYSRLVNELKPDEILDCAVEYGLIDQGKIKDIREMSLSRQKNREIIDQIMLKDRERYLMFKNILQETDQSWASEALEKYDGEARTDLGKQKTASFESVNVNTVDNPVLDDTGPGILLLTVELEANPSIFPVYAKLKPKVQRLESECNSILSAFRLKELDEGRESEEDKTFACDQQNENETVRSTIAVYDFKTTIDCFKQSTKSIVMKAFKDKNIVKESDSKTLDTMREVKRAIRHSGTPLTVFVSNEEYEALQQRLNEAGDKYYVRVIVVLGNDKSKDGEKPVCTPNGLIVYRRSTRAIIDTMDDINELYCLRLIRNKTKALLAIQRLVESEGERKASTDEIKLRLKECKFEFKKDEYATLENLKREMNTQKKSSSRLLSLLHRVYMESEVPKEEVPFEEPDWKSQNIVISKVLSEIKRIKDVIHVTHDPEGITVVVTKEGRTSFVENECEEIQRNYNTNFDVIVAYVLNCIRSGDKIHGGDRYAAIGAFVKASKDEGSLYFTVAGHFLMHTFKSRAQLTVNDIALGKGLYESLQIESIFDIGLVRVYKDYVDMCVTKLMDEFGQEKECQLSANPQNHCFVYVMYERKPRKGIICVNNFDENLKDRSLFTVEDADKTEPFLINGCSGSIVLASDRRGRFVYVIGSVIGGLNAIESRSSKNTPNRYICVAMREGLDYLSAVHKMKFNLCNECKDITD